MTFGSGAVLEAMRPCVPLCSSLLSKVAPSHDRIFNARGRDAGGQGRLQQLMGPGLDSAAAWRSTPAKGVRPVKRDQAGAGADRAQHRQQQQKAGAAADATRRQSAAKPRARPAANKRAVPGAPTALPPNRWPSSPAGGARRAPRGGGLPRAHGGAAQPVRLLHLSAPRASGISLQMRKCCFCGSTASWLSRCAAASRWSDPRLSTSSSRCESAPRSLGRNWSGRRLSDSCPAC